MLFINMFAYSLIHSRSNIHKAPVVCQTCLLSTLNLHCYTEITLGFVEPSAPSRRHRWCTTAVEQSVSQSVKYFMSSCHILIGAGCLTSLLHLNLCNYNYCVKFLFHLEYILPFPDLHSFWPLTFITIGNKDNNV